MADLLVTDIVLGGQATRQLGVQFGETVAKTDWLYRKASDNKYYKADCNVTVAEAATVGICLVGGATDAFGVIVTSGLVILTITAPTMDIGDAYYLSPNPGKMMPQADLASGNIISYLGGAQTVLNFDVSIKNYANTLA